MNTFSSVSSKPASRTYQTAPVYTLCKIIKKVSSIGFIAENRNIIFMGKPGVGKTHLANSIGMQALSQGYNVLFAHVHTLLDKLQQGRLDGSHRRLLNQACPVDLLILDELGFRAMPPNCLDGFFELIRARYENKPTIFTSNRNFEDWAHVFGDKVLAGAIIGRIVHHAHIIRIAGDSYRVKDFVQKPIAFE